YARDFRTVGPVAIRAALNRLSNLAAALRINLLAGSATFRGGKRFNSLVVFDRGGQMIHCYSKCQLTERDREFFSPGNSISLFEIDGVCATAIICHERRYPELVRLA